MTQRMSNLDRTLKLVHSLTESFEGLTLGEMAALLDVNRRTVERRVLGLPVRAADGGWWQSRIVQAASFALHYAVVRCARHRYRAALDEELCRASARALAGACDGISVGNGPSAVDAKRNPPVFRGLGDRVRRQHATDPGRQGALLSRSGGGAADARGKAGEW